MAYTKELTVAGMKLTPMGLHLPAKTTMNDWVACGEALSAVSEARCWAIGDWWAFGVNKKWDRTISENGHICGIPRQRVYNYAQVSAAFPKVSSREENLTFLPHRWVVELVKSQADRRRWLNRAAKEGWSAARLKREITGDKPKKKSKSIDRRKIIERWKATTEEAIYNCETEADLRRLRLAMLNAVNAINAELEMEPIDVTN